VVLTSRVSRKSSRAKRKAKRVGGHPKPVSQAQLRKSARKSQLRIGLKKIEMKKVISPRGRTHPMEAPLPGMPEEPQALLMESTVISRFKYNLKTKTLRIWFQSRHIYDYYDVPESVVMLLDQAQSKGRFFYYNIRTTYTFRRIR